MSPIVICAQLNMTLCDFPPPPKIKIRELSPFSVARGGYYSLALQTRDGKMGSLPCGLFSYISSINRLFIYYYYFFFFLGNKPPFAYIHVRTYLPLTLQQGSLPLYNYNSSFFYSCLGQIAGLFFFFFSGGERILSY